MRFILLVDSVTDAQAIGEHLRLGLPGCEGRCIKTLEALVETLQANDFDLVLSDYYSEGFDRLAALALIRLERPEKPFIFVAGSIGEDLVVELILNGATDFVHLDRIQRLVPAIKQALLGEGKRERRAQKDEALLKAEVRILEQAALLDQAQDAIIVQNLAGGVTYWNKGAENIYGWTAEEMMSGNGGLLQLIEPDRHQIAQKQTLKHGEWRGELRQKTKSGAEVMVQSRWTLVQDDQGLPTAFLVINTDVTENKLLEIKFLRAQRLESMGMLVGGIAHDLNNVLSPILMSVEMLRSEVKEPDTLKLTQTIHRSVKHGAALVQQLLSFARGTEGQHEELDLQPLLTEFVDFLSQTLSDNISLELILKQPPDLVLADATQLKQVLMNLCINARDAMVSGGHIAITVENVELDAARAHLLPKGQPGMYVLISVADTGCGISPEVMERIFDPFFTTKETGHGTGLGLSTALGIVKGHGGFITVENDVAHGTIFHIYLPVHTHAVKASGPTQYAPSSMIKAGEGALGGVLPVVK
jgi:two-component system cell cycle sensor histidine kinase/response regulator CckA